MTTIAGASFWTMPGLSRVLGVLNADGEEARVVGGAVRNTLLGVAVADVDIATTALPQVVAARARAAGLKPVPTGIAHGTVTVVADGQPFEVTTLREDTETDGRHAVVRFGRDWGRDAERRDFTMNALYATADGTVVDLVGGLADLAARRVRFIGDAQARIREDYLRILRLFRFHATYGAGAVDADAFTASVRLRAGLSGLSGERVRAELLKLVLAPRAAHALEVMADGGLLQILLAGIADVPAFARLAALEARTDTAPSAVRRLAALAVRVSDDVDRLRARLRLSNAERRRLAQAVRGLPVLEAPQDVRAFLYTAGVEAACDRALLSAAHGCARALDVVAEAQAWSVPRRPFGANDLIARGMAPGPALGGAVAQAERDWIAQGFPDTPEAVAALLAAIVTRTAGG